MIASDSFPDFSSNAAREFRATGGGGFFGRLAAFGIGGGAVGTTPDRL